MRSSTRNKDELTLHAYCDGELDASTNAEFERRLSADAGLRDSYNGVMALRSRANLFRRNWSLG